MQTNTTKEVKIGIVTLRYNDNGDLKEAYFAPAINVRTDEIISQLENCKGKSIEELTDNARLVLAAFFNKVSIIELRDFETTEIEANVVRSGYFPGTQVYSDIEIEFIYKQK